MDEKNQNEELKRAFEKPLNIVSIKQWIFLFSSLLLFIPILLWLFLGSIPISAEGKCVLFDPTASSDPKNLKIYGFIPLFAAQSISPGMKVSISLDGVELGTQNLIQGTVSKVLPYPVDLSEEYVKQIPSLSLKEYLLSGDIPLILVIGDPVVEESSAKMQSGMTGIMTIVLRKEKPISFIIPSFSAEGR